jgi:hypothetical protein
VLRVCVSVMQRGPHIFCEIKYIVVQVFALEAGVECGFGSIHVFCGARSEMLLIQYYYHSLGCCRDDFEYEDLN